MSNQNKPFTALIPPAAEVRERLAVVATEAALLRKLLQVATRREREIARLASIGTIVMGAAHAAIR